MAGLLQYLSTRITLWHYLTAMKKHMSKIKDFAFFVRQTKLEEFVMKDFVALRAFNIPFLSGLNDDQLKARIREDFEGFLISLENNTSIQRAEDYLARLERNELPGIRKSAVSVSGMVKIFSTQKISLFTFIPQFTDDSSVAVEIISGLEEYFRLVQELSLNLLLKIHTSEQQKLVESEEKYKDLFDNANDMIHFVAPDGKILYANKAWKHALGYPQDEYQGKSIYSFVVDSEREQYIQYRKRVLSGEKDLPPIETCYKTINGKEITVEGYISCKFKDGIPMYTRAILRNITEKKASLKKLLFYTKELNERSESMQQLIHYAPDAVIVIDENSRIKLWNPKAESIFGWKMHEVIGRSLTETIIPNRYRETHTEGLKRLLQTGEIRILNKTIEITALHREGHEFYISLTISRARMDGQSEFIAFSRDISEQKKNALELEKKRAQLEKSNNELEQYAWLTSHDLKEPLRKILTFSDLLLIQHDSEFSAKAKIYLEKIQKVAFRMNDLIEDLLNYSNLSRDQNYFITSDLNEIVKETLADLELIIQEKSADIQIAPLPVLKVIPHQMRQLFQNLLVNALKYSKTGVAPFIEIFTMETEDQRVEIHVRDNGIGFEKQYADKIFQVFQRLYTMEKYEGTGIGLALCKRIVENHDGHISAVSEKGVGSTFIINLPVTK
jgi:PAS domain S-box-containing protein